MSFRKRFVLATPMLCVIAYLLMGFIGDLWHPGWIVFFLIPVVPCILGTKALRIGYPFFCLAVFLFIGLFWDLWHPGWVIFLTIPVFATLFPNRKYLVKIGRDSKKSNIINKIIEAVENGNKDDDED